MPRYKDMEKVIRAIKNRESADSFEFNEGLIAAMNAIDEVPDADVEEVKHGEWISVKERLPEKSGQVFVFRDEGVLVLDYDDCIDDETERFGVAKEYFDNETLGWCGSEWIPITGVTHWMPMPPDPEPPEVEG